MSHYLRNLALTGLATTCLFISACDSTVITCETNCPEEMEATPNIIDTATTAGNFNTLLAALESASLTQVLSDPTQEFTVFAPSDAAFEGVDVDALLADTDALTDTLLYHVYPGSVDAAAALELVGSSIAMQNSKAAMLSLDGESLKINDATVTAPDVMASNGIIHVIDTVLTPPVETVPVNIIRTAESAGNFNTLLTALAQSGNDAVLADESQQFTVFAPTDAAFELLGEAAVNDLLADAAALDSTLLYHVLPGLVNATTAISLVGADDVVTQQGSTIALSLDGDTLKVNDASVIATDIMASNGIIHVIDAVLIPDNVDMGL